MAVTAVVAIHGMVKVCRAVQTLGVIGLGRQGETARERCQKISVNLPGSVVLSLPGIPRTHTQ